MRSFSLAVAIGLICLLTSITWAAEGDKPLALRQNVLRVSSAGTGENGFGFIVSERDGKLYIVTADHVVVGTPDTPAPSVRVVFFTDQGKSYRAEVLKHKTDHDLALLEVERPPGFTWEKQCLATAQEETRGTSVWFIGRDEEWYVPAANGLISSPNPSADAWLDADMPNLRPGSSGGPLVTNTGIIGMVKAKSTDDTRVLSIEYIKNAVRDWGYEWDLVNPTASASGRAGVAAASKDSKPMFGPTPIDQDATYTARVAWVNLVRCQAEYCDVRVYLRAWSTQSGAVLVNSSADLPSWSEGKPDSLTPTERQEGIKPVSMRYPNLEQGQITFLGKDTVMVQMGCTDSQGKQVFGSARELDAHNLNGITPIRADCGRVSLEMGFSINRGKAVPPKFPGSTEQPK